MVHIYIFLGGFHCSMETSRRIRVGTRNYTTRIAAVSQEHVLVGVTRKITRPENDMVLVLASKLTWLLCGWSKYTWFQWLDFSVVSNWIVFVRERLSFSVRTEIDLFFVRGSKLTFFVCACRKLFVFSVIMEIELVVVMLTWSQCGGSNSNWFQSLLCGW